jgi:DNA-binding MarR family transcriptional regulator
MNTSTDRTREDYAAMAERIASAYTSITKWSARDFKRARVPRGLSQTQLQILGIVACNVDVTASHLAERLDLSVPTIVRALDALERKGLLHRERSSADRREIQLTITDEGDRVRQEIERARRERMMDLLTTMEWAEVEGLVLGFEGMARAATQHHEESQAV